MSFIQEVLYWRLHCNSILFWGSSLKSEADEKIWACGVIWDSSIYFISLCDKEPATIAVSFFFLD